jgi:phospholipase/carboxylesterase
MKRVVAWRRPAKRGASTPLVVFLHGRGADETDLIDLAAMLPRSYEYASLRAPVPVEGGGYTWFENRGPARPIPASVRSSVDDLRGWLDSAASGRSLYLFGFSAGMMMAAALVLDAPERYAGAVLLSGAIAFDAGLPVDRDRLAGLRVFYGRGSLDTVIPADLVRRTNVYLRETSGAVLTERQYPHEHSISNREMADIAEWFGK